MHEWTVAGAVIEGPDGVLLVKNRRRNGRHDWSPPGGVIDEGETLIEGLGREVVEETGLIVTEWAGPIYQIEATAPGLGWTLRVEAFQAVVFSGEILLEDPDGIVVDAGYVVADDCPARLVGNHPWVVEPLSEWLVERWSGCRTYGYRIEGSELASLEVTRDR